MTIQMTHGHTNVCHVLSLAKITRKISFLVILFRAISVIVFATGSLALRGLIIFGLSVALRTKSQPVGLLYCVTKACVLKVKINLRPAP